MSDDPLYCDIVMKGGITSGIVYPNAVTALAKKYRFKNIGGTSAGAIAAAAAAAASLGQRCMDLQGFPRPDSGAGYAGLAAVADKLSKRGFIYGLFQPAPAARILYGLLIALARKPSRPQAILAVVVAAVRIGARAALIAALVLFGLAWMFAGWSGMLAAFIPAIVCVLAVAMARTVFKAAQTLRDNELGLCSGLTVPPDNLRTSPGLTDWLHDVLQALAGKSEDQPLTFNDLWNAPSYPDEPETRNTIQLSIITTGVSHHEPRTLPFEQSRFWYCEEEFRRLFPKCLIDAIADEEPLTIDGRRYRRLPEGGALPVLIATRMSLSFPLLISAVPLYEADYVAAAAERTDPDGGEDMPPKGTRSAVPTEGLATGGKRTNELPTALRVCWFSDGGIASNFPIHLFDTPLPRWPTFAIDLAYPKSTEMPENPIFLPTENNQGWQRVYSSFKSESAVGEVGGFLFAIIATMQNWRDLLQSRAPGYRDRIVHVSLATDEGGMNLDMPQCVLDRIAAKGTAAGEVLASEFDFNNHWWIRWRNVASAAERYLEDFAVGAGPALNASYQDARDSASTGKPASPSYPFTRPQEQEAQGRYAKMNAEGELYAKTVNKLTKRAPKPLPVLRITPTF